MYKVRSDEPAYAFLWDRETQKTNRYGQTIETVPEGNTLRDEDFVINGEPQAQKNPNRYKQHGFYFNADNCIGCHACEAACSEKNENPGHIAFRSVGYVESGTHPAYQRINISLACNHCDDPVCLKGCPTRAYTKFAEYGAVLQDPDICFGCGYCTWVCPYNAPQLDPVKGQVSKCNMCVDRLEVGLKPACVAACLGSALDFGVVENIPENRDQALTAIPGFPDPEITHPNIRFQQTRSLQRDVTRPDATPVKYHRDDEAKKYRPVVDKKLGDKREWNWNKLLTSHENAHAMFTLAAQTVMGAFMLLIFGPVLGLDGMAQLKQSSAFIPLLGVMLALLGFGLFKLNMHLGKPHRFYRGYNNLRLSPVSREIAGVSAFFAGLAGYSFFSLFSNGFAGFLAGLFALLGVAGFAAGSWYMYKLYRIKARPFWDHWQTASTFYGSMLSLGSLLVAVVSAIFMDNSAE
ncbi:MAG: aspartate carbamoyltransferase, partial [Gammaproteobacteria bacterium]